MREADLKVVQEILGKEYYESTSLASHEVVAATAEVVFDQEAERVTCPACSTAFSPSELACPECGLCFGG